MKYAGLLALLPLLDQVYGSSFSFSDPFARLGRSHHPHPKALTKRATPVLPSGWSYSACVTDSATARTLTGYYQSSPNVMTVDKCVSTCNKLGFKLAGLEWGQECFCGNQYDNTASGSGAVAPASDCSMKCAGDATQTCGNGNRLSVYSTVQNTYLASGWSWYNCVHDLENGQRTLAGYSFTSATMTVQSCVNTCSSKGFTYAGLEYSSECYCGNSFAGGGGAPASLADCSMPCSGDPTSTCGGGYRLSTYHFQGQAQPSPTTTTTQPTPTTTPTPPSGWSYYGCVHEPSSGRALTGYSVTSTTNTIESCITACQSRGFTYAGAEYGSECYCGNAFQGTNLGGGAIVADSQCDKPCAGNPAEICGGGWLMSTYKSSAAPPPAGTPNLPPYWSATAQCLTDSVNSRALVGNSQTSNTMTLSTCIDICDQTGFKYAGAEYASECYCSNTISTANGVGQTRPLSECNMPCAGDNTQTCGAGNRLTVYTKTPPASSMLAGWHKNFCSVDQASPRVLSGSYTPNIPNLTPALCMSMCDSQGYTLAGVENGNECFCDNKVNIMLGARDVECGLGRVIGGTGQGVACTGDNTQGCGGGWRIMVYQKDAPTPSGSNAWTLQDAGNSGVVMTHIAVFDSDTVLVIDRKEANPLLNQQGLSAWGAVWSISGQSSRALNIETHSFCSAGSFLSNGTLANFGGHPYLDDNGQAAPDGMQGVRMFSGCAAGAECDMYEYTPRIRLSSNRWYPASARLYDGSALIIGGMSTAGTFNIPSLNNPTYEFFPAKNINGHNGTQIQSQFFVDTLPYNIYPPVLTLPSKKLFVASNNQAMILDWEANTEQRLPNFPNGHRVAYPLSTASFLLPLTPENNYTPEVVLCGGSQISDQIPVENLDAQHDYGTAQCSRMVLNDAGIAGGWQVEYMPEPRIMGDGVMLPTGKILILNGFRTGTAGYGNLQYRIGDSNGDNPVYTPILYDPAAPAGSRFSRDNLPTSNIGRLYHGTATLLPSGAIMIGGSNPNDNFQTRPWGSELRVQYLNPWYMNANRPTFSGTPTNLLYGQPYVLTVNVPAGATNVYVVLMDLGFVTHAVHMDQKFVKLVSVWSGNQIAITGPPSAAIYSPGPGWLWVLADGVPSMGQRVMVGDGANPPENPAATANMLNSTPGPN